MNFTETTLAMMRAWDVASHELQIRVATPFRISDQLNAPVYLADFGGPNGMIIDAGIGPALDGIADIRKFAAERNLYYSILNPMSYMSFERTLFLEALHDWGYFGNEKWGRAHG